MKKLISLNSKNLYEIRVRGNIDASWLEGFGATGGQTDTTNCGKFSPTLFKIATDQAGLVGLVRRMHGLGILLLSIKLTRGNSVKAEASQPVLTQDVPIDADGGYTEDLGKGSQYRKE